MERAQLTLRLYIEPVYLEPVYRMKIKSLVMAPRTSFEALAFDVFRIMIDTLSISKTLAFKSIILKYSWKCGNQNNYSMHGCQHSQLNFNRLATYQFAP